MSAIVIRDPIDWDGYVYHGTKDRHIESTCPICGKELVIWWSRYYDGTSFDQIEGCQGECSARDIYARLNAAEQAGVIDASPVGTPDGDGNQGSRN